MPAVEQDESRTSRRRAVTLRNSMHDAPVPQRFRVLKYTNQRRIKNTMSIPSADLVETTYNLYDADGTFQENYANIAEAKKNCEPGDKVVERHRYEYAEDGNTVHIEVEEPRDGDS